MDARVDDGFWRGKRVFLTGHTGFKGSWLALWLQALGAHVTGFAAAVPSSPSLFELGRVGEQMGSIEGDIRDYSALAEAIEASAPEIVIHLAAQALVRRSFAEPRQTFETNVMGTVNLLQAIAAHGHDVRAVVSVTSDKCYENDGRTQAYAEGDALGGHDPYSSSKGCAELVTGAFRRSFLGGRSELPGARAAVASARAGNVIGGGDWGEDRLLPDFMSAALAHRAVHVRNPDAVRPWQHVLNPLSGYLLLAQALWDSAEYARAWNFGPPEQDERTVAWIVERASELWPGRVEWSADAGPHPHEARFLKLDSSLARQRLGWRPLVDLDTALEQTVSWYRQLAAGADMRAVTLAQIEAARRGAPAN